MNKRKHAIPQRATKNCPVRRLDLGSFEWQSRCTAMLAFCCACHIGTVAILVGYIAR